MVVKGEAAIGRRGPYQHMHHGLDYALKWRRAGWSHGVFVCILVISCTAGDWRPSTDAMVHLVHLWVEGADRDALLVPPFPLWSLHLSPLWVGGAPPSGLTLRAPAC